MAVYNVHYAAGELKAIGYSEGKQVNQSILKTAERSDTIKLSADRTTIKANNEDLSYITIELLDAHGVKNPKAENLVHFEIDGPGMIAGVANANPVSLESYELPQRKAWHGRCMVVVKSTHKPGKIILQATGDGLRTAAVAIIAE
jgi:beta-galactosidase